MKPTNAEIEQLVEQNVPESNTLEYKREFYKGDDKSRHEFLKDITAFANSQGGSILVGIDEGPPVTVLGVTSESIDLETRRMQTWLNTRIDPKIAGIEFERIPFHEKVALRISVPATWNRPHRVVDEQRSYFYLRSGTVNHLMDTSQLRTAILSSFDQVSQARALRDERVLLIESNNLTFKLRNGIKHIVHLCPIGSSNATLLIKPSDFPSRYSIDTGKHTFELKRFFGFEGARYAYSKDSGYEHEIYSVVFRNGCIEILRSDDKHGVLDSDFTLDWFSVAAMSGLKVIQEWHNGPVAIMLTLCNVLGQEFGKPNYHAQEFDIATVPAPEVIIYDTPQDKAELREWLLPAFTVVFQSASLSGP